MGEYMADFAGTVKIIGNLALVIATIALSSYVLWYFMKGNKVTTAKRKKVIVIIIAVVLVLGIVGGYWLQSIIYWGW